MDVRLEMDAEEDLPEDDRPEDVQQARTFMRMLEGTVESAFDDLFDPDIVVNLKAEIDGEKRRFSLNDPKWCILCHECNMVVAANGEAQEVYKGFVEHLESESNTCIKKDYAIDNDRNRLESMREAIEESRRDRE